MKLGVFDSGIGGEAVAETLRGSFMDATVLVVDDHNHVPYGTKTDDEILKLTDAAIQPLLSAGCDIIVIACNSATSAAIETLRERYPSQLFIGLEPMIKPAVGMTKTGVIAVCATPATLASTSYKSLKQAYAAHVTVLEPDCATWASMIEHDQIDELIIKNTVHDLCEQGADVIVMACTHYHWIRDTIDAFTSDRVAVIDPSEAIVSRVESLLKSR